MTKLSGWTEEHLPVMILILFILQPLMDILSFWADQLALNNLITLAPRMLVLVCFALLGFLSSRKKAAYFAFAGAVIFLAAGHIYACSVKGYLRPVPDLTNYVRVIQMPLFTICFISCLKRNRRCYRALEKGCVINFWLISASVALALITGTAAHTYDESGFGIIGWFSTTNAQSAILSILVPIVVTLSYRQRNFPLFFITALVGFVELYFFATRLAYFTIAVTVFGLLITAVLTKNVSKKYFLVLFVMLAVVLGTYKLSPMYGNQARYLQAMDSKQGDANTMMARVAEKEGLDPNKKVTLKTMIPRLRVIYRYYNQQLCRRFNVYRVMKAYDYSYHISDITAVRQKKIIFCSLLMDEHPAISRVFGMELERMSFHDVTFDVENDFHGIYFLYGWAGLALMIAFLGWFLFLIIRALIRNFRQFFTIEAGAFGMGLCLALVYAYLTAGVLRRPNSSFYLSVLLAAVYYLTQLRYYPQLSDSEDKEKA